MNKQKKSEIVYGVINKPISEIYYNVNFCSGLVELFWSSTKKTDNELEDYCLTLPFNCFKKDAKKVNFGKNAITNDLTICNPYLTFSKQEIVKVFTLEYYKKRVVELINVESI